MYVFMICIYTSVSILCIYLCYISCLYYIYYICVYVHISVCFVFVNQCIVYIITFLTAYNLHLIYRILYNIHTSYTIYSCIGQANTAITYYNNKLYACHEGSYMYEIQYKPDNRFTSVGML